MTATLYVFSGLPGTGKSTLARQLAQACAATYLRVDSVEATLLNAGLSQIGVEGYAVIHALAADNLALGRPVIVDCVNPVGASRQGWTDLAGRTGVPAVNIAVTCTDLTEHQRRVERRRASPEGRVGRWAAPTWPQVLALRETFEPWTGPHLLVDTARGAPEEHLNDLLRRLSPPAPRP